MSPDRPAEVRETHIGVVFLLGDRAYKLKKPVRTGFLDFTTPQRRLAACRREIELNRRLAPDVYLGICGVSGVDDPDTAEYLVVMRRMPDERRLSTLVRAGVPVEAHLRALARAVAAFHARARRGPRITVEGGRDALRGRWAANVAEVRGQAPVLDDVTVDAVDRLSRQFLAGRQALFTDRCAHGRVVDGHGDLIADDVFCLDDGPRALDCLEFDDRLRYVDVLDDAAFLAMDLERLGRPDAAATWLDAYAEFSGDPAPSSLRHHYIAYRAFVRAKVACLRSGQGDPGSAAEAGRYAELALGHLRSGAVRLVLVGGLPGTGKTTVAGALADRVGAVLLSSDRVRKERAGVDPHRDAAAPYGRGLYTAARTEELYAELLHRAEELLARGESVVLDASWIHRRHRDAAAEVARRAAAELVPLHCTAPREVARERLATRARTASDATGAVAVAMAAEADPWPEACVVATTGGLGRSVERAAAAWDAAVWDAAPDRPRASAR